MKWIEQWGSGLHRIMKECAQRGLQKPKFEELNNQFRVTLYGKKISKIVFESWHKELINYLKKKEKISTKQAAYLWKVTERTARTRLIKLIDAGIVKKIGSSLKDPYGAYILMNTLD